MSKPVVQVRDLHHAYRDKHNEVSVLQGIDLDVYAGESVAIVGASGSGKSTLLNMLGGLDNPIRGQVHIDGQSLLRLSERGKGRLRNDAMGFVYQFHHLLPEFSALENAAMPLLIGKASVKAARERATEVLEAVGLGHRLRHKPSELSGGERQRVAIARAIVGNPKVVLADEPTGNLDETTALHIQDVLLSLTEERRMGLIVVTHDLTFAQRCLRQLQLQNGQLHPL